MTASVAPICVVPTKLVGALLVGFHLVLLLSGGWSNGWFQMEGLQLACGVLQWETGDDHAMLVNPPLVRCWAAVPILPFVDLTKSGVESNDPRMRQEAGVAADLFRSMGDNHQIYLRMARWFSAPLSLLGICVCYVWAKECYGKMGGVLAAWLYCFSPQMIGHGQLIPTDAAAASFGVTAMYSVSCWLRMPLPRNAIFAGIAVGIAILCKTTWLILFAIIPGCLIANLWNGNPGANGGRKKTLQLALLFLVALYMVNIAYGFRGTGTPLGSYRFFSTTLTGESTTGVDYPGGNRFATSLLGNLPVPLPAAFVQGVDLQKWDMQRRRLSYLRGEWRERGWPYYYLYGLAIKESIGTWILCLVALGMHVKGMVHRNKSCLIPTCVWLPGLCVLALVSAELGLNRHLRYVLPALPFWFIGISSIAGQVIKYRSLRLVTLGCCCQMATSTLWCHPHCLSYFNEFVGGPRNGFLHMTDSNLHAGQDEVYLERWIRSHPEATVFRYDGAGNVREAGTQRQVSQNNLQSGWYAVAIEHFTVRSRIVDHFMSCPSYLDAGYGFRLYYIDERQIRLFKE